MTTIQILPQDFAAAPLLTDLLRRRRLDLAEAGDKAHTLVCSAAAEAAMGGARGLTEKARAAGARMLVVVDDASDTFAVTEDMGGRILRVGLPHSQAEAQENGPLLAVAELIAAQAGGMVAVDVQTGKLMDMARRVGRTDVTVFINGPTGTGKEVLARQVHAYSPRKDAPFVAINCAAIPENMLEAILFGHEKGAFTGASTANPGIVRAAQGGTLLLDEISEMPMGLQAKLLRVLQEKTVTPIGSQKEVAVDIRVIATSNRDMLEEVRRGTFREDLYYRLNVFPLATTALKDRKADIPALAVAMIRRHAVLAETLPMLRPCAIDALMAHDWPGNVRELENVVQRALVLHENAEITAADIMIHAGASIDLADTPALEAA